MERTDVIFEFGAIRSVDDALSFASRHGLLSRGPDSDELSESLADWKEEIGFAHAVIRFGSLLRYALAGDKEAETELWERFEPILRPIFEQPAKSREDLLDQSSWWLVWAINSKLEGTEIRVTAESRWEDGQLGHFMFNPQPPHLLGSIYLELAQLLVNRRELRFC